MGGRRAKEGMRRQAMPDERSGFALPCGHEGPQCVMLCLMPAQATCHDTVVDDVLRDARGIVSA